MADKSISWSFLNQETGQNVDRLDFDQAKFVTSMIDHKARVAWLVWHDGLADWMNLEECDQLIGTIMRERPLPPIPPNRPSAKKSKQNEPADGLATLLVTTHESKSERHEKRVNRRVHKNFRVEIVASGGGLVMAMTENISLGGMMFQNVLPPQVERAFTATIIRLNHAKLQVLCEQIRPPRGASETGCRRVRFVKVEDFDILNSWLLDQGLE